MWSATVPVRNVRGKNSQIPKTKIKKNGLSTTALITAFRLRIQYIFVAGDFLVKCLSNSQENI